MMAEVTVSRSRIENFIAPGNANVGNVSGSGLFAESQREIVQRKVRGEIFDRLFRGFPSEVMEVKIDAIKPDVHDPSVFNLFVTVSYSKSWINALMSTLGTLQIAAYRIDLTDFPFSSRISKANPKLKQYALLPNEQLCKGKASSSTFCFNSDS